MLSGQRTAVAYDQIGRFIQERMKSLYPGLRLKIEVNARMNAALAKMSLQIACVAELFQQLAKIA